MESWDYIVVGAGSAGCVLAERLSAIQANKVLLIEAGPDDSSFLYRMPKGFGKILSSPGMIWHFEAEGDAGNNHRKAIWHRGKTLGGSSAINGMVYMRGQPQDYDGWEAQGLTGWGWAQMKSCFRAMEDHSLGADALRGAGGPLKLTAHHDPDPVCTAFVAAAQALGLERRNDINREAQEGVAYTTRTISGGVRMSAARAFLAPNRKRPNLTIRTGIEIDQVRFEGRKAVSVTGRDAAGQPVNFRARREIILSAGAIQSPLILQRSGIGPAALLQGLGIEVLQDSPDVGQNMREHYLLMLNYRLKSSKLSYNRSFSGCRLAANLLRYSLTRTGPLSNGSHDACAFFRTNPSFDRPDAEILTAAWSLGPKGALESEPGMHLFAYTLRPESAGSVSLRSAAPGAPPLIQPRYLATEKDRLCAVNGFRFLRKLMATRPIADLVTAETRPGSEVRSDDEILDAYRRLGQIGHHAAGTCRMGGDGDNKAVLDKRLRVRGVAGLRVCDISAMPELVSGNTNGPAMAMGWRAAEIIAEDERMMV
jgi:choline dehydrogenase-like flavoprotein